MVASDATLIGTVTRMTDSLWVAKRSTLKGGDESTVYSKGDAIAYVQGACSSLMVEELVSQEPDTYEYTIKTVNPPTVTYAAYNSETGRSVIQGTGLAGVRSVTITYSEGVVVYTRTALAQDHDGDFTDVEISFDTPSSIGENVTLYMVTTGNGNASIASTAAPSLTDLIYGDSQVGLQGTSMGDMTSVEFDAAIIESPVTYTRTEVINDQNGTVTDVLISFDMDAGLYAALTYMTVNTPAGSSTFTPK